MPINFSFVLLAGDNEDDRPFFLDAFEELKIKTKVEFVRDASELLEYLTDPEKIIPDILFLELNMLKKTVHECLIEIKNNDNLKNLIIAIYSSFSLEEDIEDVFIKGANIYIKKPNDFTAFKKIIHQVMAINWQYQTGDFNREIFLHCLK